LSDASATPKSTGVLNAVKRLSENEAAGTAEVDGDYRTIRVLEVLPPMKAKYTPNI
jgi:hypothetical protein